MGGSFSLCSVLGTRISHLVFFFAGFFFLKVFGLGDPCRYLLFFFSFPRFPSGVTGQYCHRLFSTTFYDRTERGTTLSYILWGFSPPGQKLGFFFFLQDLLFSSSSACRSTLGVFPLYGVYLFSSSLPPPAVGTPSRGTFL